MKIHSLSIDKISDSTERISAVVDGTEIWYEVTDSPTNLRYSYDPFLLAAYVTAMLSRETIEISDDAPVSEQLIQNLYQAMEIYCQWWPILSKVEILSENIKDEKDNQNDYVGCFFSGGADSIYSFIQNQQEITHLILCQGLDIQADEEDRWEQTVKLNREFADTWNKKLITINTNVKAPLDDPNGPDDVENYGAILVSTALGLGLKKLIVPASQSLNLLARDGSHLLLDPLYSNDQTEIIHDSPVERAIKVEAIAKSKIGLDALRVCNASPLFNCGTCEKCLRTRTILTLLGVETDSLKLIKDTRELRTLNFYNKWDYVFWEENLRFAEKLGNKDFYNEIEKLLRDYRVRRAIQVLDKDFFGGAFYKLKQLLR